MLFQELTAGETDDDGAELIVKPAGDAESMTMQELNEQPGLVRLFDGDGEVRDEWSFSAFRDARLAFGLWEECGPFDLPVDVQEHVPVEIAVAGTAYLAAYLYLNLGAPDTRARETVAERLDVTKSTVSNHLSNVRYAL